MLEEIGGVEVVAYRAQVFQLQKKLPGVSHHELGLKWTVRYLMRLVLAAGVGRLPEPFIISDCNKELVELPLLPAKMLSLSTHIRAAGIGYYPTLLKYKRSRPT